MRCADDSAFNYSFNANTDDGSCIEAVLGCTDETTITMMKLQILMMVHVYQLSMGCTDPDATNYNDLNANTDGSVVRNMFMLV